MTRQLISTNRQPLLRSPHAKRPPPGGFVQTGLWEVKIGIRIVAKRVFQVGRDETRQRALARRALRVLSDLKGSSLDRSKFVE